MHRLGKYTASDRMSDLVCGNYHILLIMSRFGIALGFGDRTVDEVCCQSGVDTATFLAVVNLLYDEGTTTVDCRNVSLEAFLRYLHNSHDYFLQYRLPDIRRKLSEAVACGCDGIAEAIIRFFDDYAAEVHKHMMYEEETVFPYVRQLLTGECPAGYDIETFHRQHDQIEAKLTELKNILIKYYPASESCGKEMNGVLFDIFLWPPITTLKTGCSFRLLRRWNVKSATHDEHFPENRPGRAVADSAQRYELCPSTVDDIRRAGRRDGGD